MAARSLSKSQSRLIRKKVRGEIGISADAQAGVAIGPSRARSLKPRLMAKPRQRRTPLLPRAKPQNPRKRRKRLQ